MILSCFHLVFIVLVNAKEFRTLMYHANILGMAEGDYVFIIIQLAEVDWWGSYKSFLKSKFCLTYSFRFLIFDMYVYKATGPLSVSNFVAVTP